MMPGIQELYHANDILVMRKPANVPMDGNCEDTVEKRIVESGYLTKDGEGEKKIKWVHQLDSPTSGILCVALSKRAASVLAHCFQTRTVRKEYTAIILGHLPVSSESNPGEGACFLHSPVDPSTDESQLCLPIHILVDVGRDPEDAKEFKMKIFGQSSKSAHTEILAAEKTYISIHENGDGSSSEQQTMGAFCGCMENGAPLAKKANPRVEDKLVRVPVTRLRIRLHTGRRHQIRVHLAQVLHQPIMNDCLYGRTFRGEEGPHVCDGPIVDRAPQLMLHACKLSFPLNFDDLSSFPSRLRMRSHTRALRKSSGDQLVTQANLEFIERMVFESADEFHTLLEGAAACRVLQPTESSLLTHSAEASDDKPEVPPGTF